MNHMVSSSLRTSSSSGPSTDKSSIRNKEAVERILATVEAMPEGELHAMQRSTSRGDRQAPDLASNGSKPAVERLLTNIQQLKEMEHLQSTLERLKAERSSK